MGDVGQEEDFEVGHNLTNQIRDYPLILISFFFQAAEAKAYKIGAKKFFLAVS